MLKKPKFDYEELVNVIKNYDVFDKVTNKLKGPSQECWNCIEKDFNHAISAKYIYTIVLQNRHGVGDKVLGIKNENLNLSPTVETFHEKETQLKVDVILSSDESQTSISEENDICNNLNFNITLSHNEWIVIFDDNQKHFKRSDGKNSHRLFYSLTSYNWTPIINEHFFEQTKLSCCMIYKRANIYSSGENFLKIDGYCSFCRSVFKGILKNKPEYGSRAIIRCTIEGQFNECTTRNKRRVIGEKKEFFLKKLLEQNMSAAYIQRTEAKQIMDYGDSEPSHLPSLNALRVMKYKENKKNHLDEDMVSIICIMKGTVPYNTIIRDICCDRFCLHYWSAPEVNSYRNYCKKTQVPTISIDATGGLIKPFNLKSGRKTGSLFLYQIGVIDHSSKSQFAVAHMISERHTNNSINYWLTEWLGSGITIPKIVVVDQSLPLMIAVVKTFTQYANLRKYISVCSSLIMKEPGVEVPLCMVRNDFNHVMHLISSWPELKTCIFRFKNFYMRSMGLVIVSTEFSDIKILLEKIFTVALNETDGNNVLTNEPTQCEMAKNYLKYRIATHTTDFDRQFTEHNKTIDNITDLQTKEHLTTDLNTTILDEIKYIYELTIENSKNDFKNTGDHDNMQFCPEIAKRILNFCNLIPCWSALMVPIFKYGNLTETSCTSESLFKDLKTVVLKHKSLPIRLDDFLKTHIDSTLGSMNILGDKEGYDRQCDTEIYKNKINNNMNKNNENKKSSQKITKNSHDTIIEKLSPTKNIYIIPKSYDDPTILENWKGLGYQVGKKKKRTYIDKDPTILYFNDSSHTKSRSIGLLKNGNISDLKSIKIDDKLYSLTNTCTFDSIFQLICSSYIDSSVYATWINCNTSYIFFELIANTIRDGINSQTYKKRAYILKSIMSKNKLLKETSDGLVILDSSCTANLLLTNLFEKYPSFIEEKKCLTCHHIQEKAFTTITANLPTENIHFLVDVLKNIFEEDRKCSLCCSNIKPNYLLGSHLFIEPIIQTIQFGKKRINFEAPIILKDIPTTITLFGKQFTLRGLINFIPSPIKTGIGHFVSYNWRETNNIWERYDDLSTSIRHVRETTTVNCQFIIYTL